MRVFIFGGPARNMAPIQSRTGSSRGIHIGQISLVLTSQLTRLGVLTPAPSCCSHK